MSADPLDARALRKRGATRKLFISYARKEIAAVLPLVTRLHDEFFYHVWIDYADIPGGADWWAAIEAAIAAADAVLLMATPLSCASEYCQKEMAHARALQKQIIPLRLTGDTTEADLAKIGLAQLNWIDFATPHPDPAWEKLITDLPEVTPRNKRMLDRQFRGVHRAYLRTLFAQHDKINLTYLLDAAPREQIRLLDVYVPLFLGINLWGAIKDKKMVDWWVEPTNERGERVRPADEMPEGARRPKTIPGVEADPAIVNLIVDNMHDFTAQLAAGEDGVKDGEWSLWRIESEEAPALQKHLVITGDAGSGKSTLLKHMLLCMAGDMLLEERDDRRADLDTLGFWPHMAYTPVFIELRALATAVFDEKTVDITPQMLFDYLRGTWGKYDADLADYVPYLKEQMEEGSVIFMLDGLDEVPAADKDFRRAQIKALCAMLQDRYGECRILVTARPYAYNGDWKLEGFGHVNLAWLDEDRLEQLAEKLFAAVLKEEGTGQSAHFFEKMQETPAEMRRHPLFFTLLAAIWLNNQKEAPAKRLPVSEDAIYRACVDMLIRRWTKKDLQSGQSVAEAIGLDETRLRRFLEALAFSVHQEQRAASNDPAQFKGGKVFDVLRDLKMPKGVDEDGLLEVLAQRAGVIFAIDENLFKFAHRRFQEHLSACYLCASERFPALAVTHLAQNPLLWRDVMRLVGHEAGLNGRDLWALVKALLPEKGAAVPAAEDDGVWWRVFHAAHIFETHLQGSDDERVEVYAQRVQEWLVNGVEKGALPPVDRAALGRVLGRIGDPRPGVGRRADGLPDFEWVKVEGGVYALGDKKDEKEIFYNPLPEMEEEIEAFEMARYPVTYAQYEPFVEGDGYKNPAYWTAAGWAWREKGNITRPPYWQDTRWHIANHPVVGVSWYEAYAYGQWASAALGEKIRLPSEVEWEAAARGKMRRAYAYAGEFDPLKCNAGDTGIGRTSAVGIFPLGATPKGGIEDMMGNVWEWTQTVYEGDRTGNNDSNSTDDRVLRGGSWIFYDSNVRAADRIWLNADGRDYGLGFRCARSY